MLRKAMIFTFAMQRYILYTYSINNLTIFNTLTVGMVSAVRLCIEPSAPSARSEERATSERGTSDQVAQAVGGQPSAVSRQPSAVGGVRWWRSAVSRAFGGGCDLRAAWLPLLPLASALALRAVASGVPSSPSRLPPLGARLCSFFFSASPAPSCRLAGAPTASQAPRSVRFLRSPTGRQRCGKKRKYAEVARRRVGSRSVSAVPPAARCSRRRYVKGRRRRPAALVRTHRRRHG